LNRQNIVLENQVQNKTAQLREMFNATVGGMALMAESRDPYTAGHQHRVAQFACDIAKNMELSEDQIEAIRIAGVLHDIGKIRTPVSLLNRPGKLLKAEWELIKTHPVVGYKILKQIPFPWPIAEIVYQHHERIDGSGYPRGLKGDRIRLESKILAVADVIEAITSHRPYRAALPMKSAFNEVKNYRGKLFDKDVVDAFLKASINNQWEILPASGPVKNEQTEEAEHEMYSATDSDNHQNIVN
jgi:putative two-component system response regulator